MVDPDIIAPALMIGLFVTAFAAPFLTVLSLTRFTGHETLWRTAARLSGLMLAMFMTWGAVTYIAFLGLA